MADTNSTTELLDGLKQFIENERLLFGDVLMYETPKHLRTNSLSTETVTTPKPNIARESHPIVAEELSLFEDSKPLVTMESWSAATTLDAMNEAICTCMKCPLGATRTKFVFGVGNPNATLMFIGEAPGADEDAQGEPFVGRAGRLLTKIIEAIQFKRSDVYICNILKCRPPNNRKPTPEESELCKPYLRRQIALVRPKVIVCLGLTAAENLLGTRESMGKLRGRTMEYEGVPVMVTYHPAALLRNPNWKRPVWEDVQAVKKLHDELIGT